MKDEEYSFLQKLTPVEVKDKLRPFIVKGREVFERGEYSLVMIDSREKVYALHSTLFDDEEEEYYWWVSVDILSLYYAHYPDEVKAERKNNKNFISAIRVKNLSNCWVSVPSQFDSDDYEARLVYTKSSHNVTLTNKQTNEVIKLKTAISTDSRLAIDEAYNWFREKDLDITDLSNWLVKESL